ncbi:MAG: hypothetical protein WCO35_02450 [Candidatus Nomurabacteria bacterium]
MSLKYLAFIIPILIIQEPVSTDTGIFFIRENHLNLFLINILFVLLSVLDITVAYFLGKYLQKRFSHKKIIIKSKTIASKLENFIGKKGEFFSLILIGIINTPYLDSFLASWLNIKFKKVLTLVLIGDVIWWCISWYINIKVRQNVSNPYAALYVVVFIALIITIFSRYILKKVLK